VVTQGVSFHTEKGDILGKMEKKEVVVLDLSLGLVADFTLAFRGLKFSALVMKLNHTTHCAF
jgi:hypothetical protein